MWKLIDTESNDVAIPRRTYAAQIGPIGCLILVETVGGASTVFVPGVSVIRDTKSEGGHFKLAPVAGYGQVPTEPQVENG